MAYQIRSVLLGTQRTGSEVTFQTRGPPTFLELRDTYDGHSNDPNPYNAFRASVKLGLSHVYTAVLLPANSMSAMGEVEVEGGGYYWDSLICALGGHPDESEMLCWGKVGHVLHKIVPCGQQDTDPDNDGQLHEALQTHLGPLGRRRKKVEPSAQHVMALLLREQIAKASDQGVAPGAGLLSAAEAADVNKLPIIEIRTPTLYSLLPREEGEGQINVRASFLAGRVEWLASLMPSAQYAIDKHMPLLCRLPEQYQSAKGWSGKSPEELLKRLCSPGLIGNNESPTFTIEEVATENGEAFRATTTVNLLSCCEPIRASSFPAFTDDIARQDAALALLRKLDAYIRTTMFPQGSLHLQANTPPPPPCLPVLPAQPLATGAHKGLWGPGTWAEVVLEVELLGWKQPPAQMPSQKLFEVPVAQQRYAFALDLIKQQGSRSILDIGSGEGRLLEYLLTKKAPVDSITGMDCSADGVRKAQKRITSALADHLQNEHLTGDTCMEETEDICTPVGSLHSAEVQVLQGHIIDKADPGSWGSLHGVDMALMIEVVEHLDADVLEQVGPVVLGSLAPKVLVMTTPNKEYNVVLQRLGSSLLANNLRNSDHRFEWTREEFQTWSTATAIKYDYSVIFEGLGNATDEAKAVAGIDIENVGCATQVAIFKKDQAKDT
ncbi:probable small RNA 2'-O-methyltransferase at C-terminar half [Coccomyxa sp. Obi]|nr:probable small RNA 2'-O-methyltransferase at C-terminar half [Coccomyxa sp. Obi]